VSTPISASLCIAAAALGCITADSIWFFLGRKYGDRIVRIICMVSLEPATCVRKTENALGKYGDKMLLVAKFIPGLNVVAAPIAGQSQIGFARFLAFDFLGAFAWAATFVCLGRIFGESVASGGLALIARRFALFLFVAAVLGLFARRLLRHRRLRKQAAKLNVSARELNARIAGGDAFHIIDLRPLNGAQENRAFPGTVRQSVAHVLAHLDELPRDREVVLFCGCPGGSTSVALAVKLRSHGIERVLCLEDGLEEITRREVLLV
jgi:membrane protein DedA with SNARE-associated domain